MSQAQSVPLFDRNLDRSSLSAVLDILYVEQRKGNKNGKDWEMFVCQCAVIEEDGRYRGRDNDRTQEN